MKFLLVRKQEGRGWYSRIACRTAATVLTGESAEEVLDQMRRDIMTDEGRFGLDRELREAILYPVSDEIEVPFEDWIYERENAELEVARIETERKERAELERLQKKFGPKT